MKIQIEVKSIHPNFVSLIIHGPGKGQKRAFKMQEEDRVEISMDLLPKDFKIGRN